MAKKTKPAGIPTDWPALIEAETPFILEGLEIVDELPEEIDEAPAHRLVVNYFAGTDSTLSAAAILLGPDQAKPHFKVCASYVPRALAEIDQGIDERTRTPAIYFLSYLNAAHCSGATLPKGADQSALSWLEQLADDVALLDERERHTLGFAALGLGATALIAQFLKGPLPANITPGEVHGFNVPAFTRYIGAARAQKLGYDDVEPAWQEFVARFPHKLAARTLDWPHLLWAGRAIFAGIAGEPLTRVAARVHEWVTS